MKILKQFVREFWIPTIIAFAWTLYTQYSSTASSWNLISIISNFGTAFFLTSWFGGQIFRIIKQQKTESSFDSVLTRLENVSKNVENVFLDIKGFSTGGESFCYFDIIRLKDGNYIIALVHSGKYPLYNITARFENLNDPEHKDIMKRPELKFGDLVPRTISVYKPKDEENAFTFEDNPEDYIKYTASILSRRGIIEQDIRIIKFENDWHTSTQVRNGDKVIFAKMTTDFPIKNPFEK